MPKGYRRESSILEDSVILCPCFRSIHEVDCMAGDWKLSTSNSPLRRVCEPTANVQEPTAAWRAHLTPLQYSVFGWTKWGELWWDLKPLPLGKESKISGKILKNTQQNYGVLTTESHLRVKEGVAQRRERRRFIFELLILDKSTSTIVYINHIMIRTTNLHQK